MCASRFTKQFRLFPASVIVSNVRAQIIFARVNVSHVRSATFECAHVSQVRASEVKKRNRCTSLLMLLLLLSLLLPAVAELL